MSKAYFLTDKDGNKIYPYGHADAVFTSDGNKVGDKLDDINTHIEDTDIHITSTERTNWDSAYTHSTSAHAPSNAQANQNAFSNVVVGTTTIAADSKTDSLTLVAGSNVTITPDATNDKITIASTDTKYTHPDSGVTAGTYRNVTVNEQGHVTAGSNPTVTVAQGGTGATDAATARTNLGITPANIGAAESSHGTHVTYSTTTPVMDGTASVGTATTVARSDHKHPSDTSRLPLAGGSMTGTINSSKATSTYIKGNQGEAIINSTASAGTYTMLDKLNSTNGVFTDGVFQGKRLFQYTSNDTIETGENKVDKSVTLLDESGNTTFPGTVKASSFNGATATTSANGLMSSTDKTKLNNTNIAYATCSTAASTAAKVATISGNDNWTLRTGSIVVVKFTVTNSASNVTLNVNNTGAKSIWYNNAVYTGNSNIVCGYANRYTTFMYDGTNWVWLSYGTDSNSTYSPATLGQGYGTCATAAATAAKVVTLSNYALVTGGIVAVKFTYAVPASATMNINSKGAKAIYHKGVAITAGVIDAGDVATFIYNGSQYHLLSIDTSANSICETIATTEPTTQSNGDHWLLEY